MPLFTGFNSLCTTTGLDSECNSQRKYLVWKRDGWIQIQRGDWSLCSGAWFQNLVRWWYDWNRREGESKFPSIKMLTQRIRSLLLSKILRTIQQPSPERAASMGSAVSSTAEVIMSPFLKRWGHAGLHVRLVYLLSLCLCVLPYRWWNTRRWPNSGLMLAHRLRRWAKIFQY